MHCGQRRSPQRRSPRVRVRVRRAGWGVLDSLRHVPGRGRFGMRAVMAARKARVCLLAISATPPPPLTGHRAGCKPAIVQSAIPTWPGLRNRTRRWLPQLLPGPWLHSSRSPLVRISHQPHAWDASPADKAGTARSRHRACTRGRRGQEGRCPRWDSWSTWT